MPTELWGIDSAWIHRDGRPGYRATRMIDTMPGSPGSRHGRAQCAVVVVREIRETSVSVTLPIAPTTDVPALWESQLSTSSSGPHVPPSFQFHDSASKKISPSKF